MGILVSSVIAFAINVTTQHIYAEGVIVIGCAVSVNNSPALILVGNCKDVGEQYYLTTKREHPEAVVTLTVDGFDYNKV